MSEGGCLLRVYSRLDHFLFVFELEANFEGISVRTPKSA